MPSNAGDAGSIPGRGTKIPHAVGQLSPRGTTTELMRLNKRAHMSQTTEPTHPGARTPQLEREKIHTPQLEGSLCTTTKSLCRIERSHTPQRRPHMPQPRPNTAKKTQEINK